MQQLSEKIANIELKVRRLAKKHNFLRKENEMLQMENKNLQKLINQYKNKNVSTGQKSAHGVKEGNPVLNNEVSVKLKEELDLYILEIDKCMEMVKNL